MIPFPNDLFRVAIIAASIYAVTALPTDEWTEDTYSSRYKAAGGVKKCSASALSARSSSYEEPEQSGELCTKLSLCHAMGLLDEARQDKSLPCKSSEGASCQQSYYSAYKCKALLVSGDQTAKRNGGTGKMCTGNSPGMITTTNTACGRVLKKYRGSAQHGKLFNWITNIAGPSIWSLKGYPAMCAVERRGRAKYALSDCDALPGKDDHFKDDGDNSYDPFANAGR